MKEGKGQKSNELLNEGVKKGERKRDGEKGVIRETGEEEGEKELLWW